jgi:hypothetical protein
MSSCVIPMSRSVLTALKNLPQEPQAPTWTFLPPLEADRLRKEESLAKLKQLHHLANAATTLNSARHFPCSHLLT